ncbi:MAG TPA: hypothetical protein VF557_07430 [Jatrophihabitans sp.]|uniref:hypothetical protein n=1 Tax=Jatrophihabitans sp. TaxID=1932789 RepID=UPI002EDBEE1C
MLTRGGATTMLRWTKAPSWPAAPVSPRPAAEAARPPGSRLDEAGPAGVAAAPVEPLAAGAVPPAAGVEPLAAGVEPLAAGAGAEPGVASAEPLAAATGRCACSAAARIVEGSPVDRRIAGSGADRLAATAGPLNWLAAIALPLPGKWASRRADAAPVLAGRPGTAE